MKRFLIHLIIILNVIPCNIYSIATNPVVLVVGTRPEGIKMIPVYNALKEIGIPTLLCSTGQHTDLLNDIFKIFNVQPDCNLAIMKPGQDLFYITTTVLDKMKDYFQEIKPSLVLVQGDTTSAMAAALAAFYLKIPVGHVEAGLRTGNIYGPFPEEINRKLIGALATYHFAPTQSAIENLIKENINPTHIFHTGNTVVDALYAIQNKINLQEISVSSSIKQIIQSAQDNHYSIMLLTAHRRESFDGGLTHIFSAIKNILDDNQNLFIIYPMHPNPIIKKTLDETCLNKMSRITIINPLIYSDLVYVLQHCNVIATDSGGIQEEAVSLGKQVVVLRNETDRMEGIYEGLAYLAGTNEEKIINAIETILKRKEKTSNNHLYGNGTAGQQIAHIIYTILYKD
jgi:UDP-N-acetylglucosamine 2-epimerase (non-hydrolysing)